MGQGVAGRKNVSHTKLLFLKHGPINVPELLERAGLRSHTRSNRVCRKLINPKSCQKANKKPWVSYYIIFIVGSPRFFFQFFGAGTLVGAVVEIFGPKTIFPTGNPFCSPAPKENPSSRVVGKQIRRLNIKPPRRWQIPNCEKPLPVRITAVSL